jgi:hypothetical protein
MPTAVVVVVVVVVMMMMVVVVVVVMMMVGGGGCWHVVFRFCAHDVPQKSNHSILTTPRPSNHPNHALRQVPKPR